MRIHNIIFLIGINILLSCANTKNATKDTYSKYSFTIQDSSYNYIFSNADEVKLELFGRDCYCEKFKDTFRIEQSFIDSLPFDFEDNIYFIGTPKIMNELVSKEPFELVVLGFINNGYFKLGVLPMD